MARGRPPGRRLDDAGWLAVQAHEAWDEIEAVLGLERGREPLPAQVEVSLLRQSGDAASWDSQLGDAVAAAAAGILPVRYSGLPVPVAGDYYEVVLNDDDLALADIGLDAGDTVPVAYAWVGVAAVDHDPWSNHGAVSAPVLIYARDLTPPDPPEAPSLATPPSAADEQGNATLRLSWSADSLYTYRLYRTGVEELGTIADVFTELPDCLAAEVPTCDPTTDGDACVDEHEAFNIRVTAAGLPETFAQVSPLPIAASSGLARSTDTLDATRSARYLYAAVAVDPAGNASELSCPSEVILVEDGVAPRAPVMRKLLGGDGAITVVWNTNREADLDRYSPYGR